MNVVFRADASLQIGSGHVMRCLSLAHGLQDNGARSRFVTRMHQGHMRDTIRQHDFAVDELAVTDIACKSEAPCHSGGDAPSHASWLGCDWQSDADQTVTMLRKMQVDWLVVDHYALDHRWEDVVRPWCRKLMVIDDLADRRHHCDLLLDQNLGRSEQDYADLLGAGAQLLVGPRYALLRDPFAALRSESLRRRRSHDRPMANILVSMGGVDQPNATEAVLDALRDCEFPSDSRISVIMGARAPWLAQVRASASTMPWPTEVLVNVDDMAQRMAASDLAIGSAGGTAWERCCLGLPSVIVVLAENQASGASALSAAGAAWLIGGVSDIGRELPRALMHLQHGPRLQRMSEAASAVTDGRGVDRVLQAMGARCE